MGSPLVDVNAIMQEVERSLEGVRNIGAQVGPGWRVQVHTTTSHTMEKRFEVGPQPSLSVHTLDGSLRVAVGEDAVIHARLSGIDSDEMPGDERSIWSSDGESVSINTVAGPYGPIGGDLIVTVPRGCSVHAQTVDGDIVLEGVQGTVNIQGVDPEVRVVGARTSCHVHTVNGDVTVKDAEGDIHLTTTDGDIAAVNCRGSFSTTTVNGDVTVRSSALTRCVMTGTDGDVSVATSIASGGEYRFKTVGGNVDLSIPPDAAADVRMKTVDGELRCELPAEIEEAGRREWRGRLNGGGSLVSLESTGGDLQIKAGSHQSVTPASPVSPVPPVTPVSPTAPVAPEGSADVTTTPAEGTPDPTIEVLARLERGEITVEAAMEELDTLR